jgi:ABC-type multidrug transport system fused ATPase/permease subunit
VSTGKSNLSYNLYSSLDTCSYVGGSVSGLTGFWTGLMKGVGAGTRVFDLLDRKSAIPLSVGKTLEKGREGPIRFEGVSFTYPSRKEVEVLKGVDLQIEVGTSLAIACVRPVDLCLSRIQSDNPHSAAGRVEVESLAFKP